MSFQYNCLIAMLIVAALIDAALPLKNHVLLHENDEDKP
jgi:hypothetical protein